MKNVWILGSTGSIGTQALDVIKRNREKYCVAGLGAGGSHPVLLARQAAEFGASVVALADERAVPEFRCAYAAARSQINGEQIGGEGARSEAVCADTAHSDIAGSDSARSEPQILAGPDAMAQLAEMAQGGDVPDVVLNGITGSVGLAPTLAALRTGATLALANKESLVAGGALVRQAMRRPGQIVPVDSEHCAIFQALQTGIHHRGLTSANLDGRSNVRRIILTASGGPFRGRKRCELEEVTLEQALAHPTWNMGPVVTINSATLMNKGLELIEAAYLFDIAPEDIVPIVHPQSAIHSMVEFIDGSTIAQASPPDMRLPIALGLSWPERLLDAAPTFDWTQAMSWTFEPLDNDAFPAVHMAREALAASPLHPAVLNAANEEAVGAFTERKLGFLGVTEVVRGVLDVVDPSQICEIGSGGQGSPLLSVESVVAAEEWARAAARQLIGKMQN